MLWIGKLEHPACMPPDHHLGFRGIFSSLMAAMAFSTFNGDIDVTLPPDTKANLKMKSDQGDIYTDFDMAVSKTTPKVENKQESGEYKISMESWVDGAINGGGPTFSFKNFNGDILIRKKKS